MKRGNFSPDISAFYFSINVCNVSGNKFLYYKAKGH